LPCLAQPSPLAPLFSLAILLLAGCTASSSDFDVAAFQHKLDAWKAKGGTGSLLPVELTSNAQNTPEDTGGRAASATRPKGAAAERAESRPVQGPMLNAIVDRVMEHVDSVTADAKVNFKRNTGLADESGAMATPLRGHAGADMPTQSGGQGTQQLSSTTESSNTERGTVARANLPPPPAPPAEDFAEAAGLLQDVPVGWTGAVIYSQPGCRPCEREINAIRNANGWTVGYGAAGFRSKAHFVVIVLTRGDEFSTRGLLGTPTTVYFREGREVGKRIMQFGGTDAELTAILAAHPSVNKASVKAALKAALESACPCAAGGVCTCVNGCRCGAACRCVNCPGRAAVSTPLYYDASPAFASGPSGFVPGYPSTSSYIDASVAVPSQVGFGISAFGTPLFGASIGQCGPGGCHP
jgi:hypothetical protein